MQVGSDGVCSLSPNLALRMVSTVFGRDGSAARDSIDAVAIDEVRSDS